MPAIAAVRSRAAAWRRCGKASSCKNACPTELRLSPGGDEFWRIEHELSIGALGDGDPIVADSGPLLAPNKSPAPTAILSPAKRDAYLDCLLRPAERGRHAGQGHL